MLWINGSVQDCGISTANMLQTPQSSTKPSINIYTKIHTLILYLFMAYTEGIFIVTFKKLSKLIFVFHQEGFQLPVVSHRVNKC